MPSDEKKLAKLKTARNAASRAAESAAWNYFCQCPENSAERAQAGEVYNNLRSVKRTGVPS